MKKIYFLLMGVMLLSTSSVYAGQDSLAQAQALLKNPEAREEVMKKDAKARQADENLVKTVGGESKEEMYGISAEVLGELAKQGNNDPEQMRKLLINAMNNPEAFKKSLSPEVQARIEAVADKTEKKRAVSNTQSKP